MRLSEDAAGCASAEAAALETAAVTVAEVWFRPGAKLCMHSHDRTRFAVMLDGAFETLFARQRLECRVETAWTLPCGARHANTVSAQGAHVLRILPNLARGDLFEPFDSLLGDARLVHSAGLRQDAWRIARELRHTDAITPLAVDALVLTILVSAVRHQFRARHHGGPPPWLLRVRDVLREEFAQPPGMSELAGIAGVSASHLTHQFRRYFLITPGEYVRQVRLHWAADQLANTQRPLPEIAAAAGFSDQSHFTRAMRRAFGITPGEYRLRERCEV